MKILLALALTAALSLNAFAADNAAPPASISESTGTVASDSTPASRESIEKLMEVMHAKSMLDSIYAQLEDVFKNVLKQTPGVGNTPADQAIVDKYRAKIWTAMTHELNWEVLKGPMEEAYMKNFTEKEVQAITAFYSTPEGQSMLKKMPGMMHDYMGSVQGMMKNILPKIQDIALQMMQELEDSHKAK